jgi:2Fe-2S ferredoxin
MVRVRVEPGGFDLDVREGEPLAEAAWRLGYRWPTVCWGQAECMVCVVEVVEGEENVLPARDEELEAMAQRLVQRRARSRLGCRLIVRGEGVVVRKAGVLPPKNG